jgi:hypothetical protein
MKTSTSFGICQLCGERASKAAMTRHLASCGPSHDSRSGSPCELLYLRAEAKGAPRFWINLEIKADSPLRKLDDLLRKVWLECCGHMSAFEIGGLRYSVVVDNEFGVDRNERSMNAKVSHILRAGQRFSYEYDFGSTTYLTLRVLGARRGVVGRPAARLLARNEPPVWACAVCGDPATLVCPFCVYERDPFCCPKHAAEHECGDGHAFLPVVNSPRMGVCGYTGEA